jgi:glycosyltransferase involved in cell wall biosynthesis
MSHAAAESWTFETQRGKAGVQGGGAVPEVSILTPTFNRRAWIPQLVRSVFAQTWLRRRGNVAEWIVLDDGTDPIGDVLQAAIRETPSAAKELVGAPSAAKELGSSGRTPSPGSRRDLELPLAQGEGVCRIARARRLSPTSSPDRGRAKENSLTATLTVRYERLTTRLPLGEKRNLLHTLSRGGTLFYFDDDDYHFPERIDYTMQVLARNPRAMAAGCSELPVWFLPENTLQVFGPFQDTHATCGTMAVRRRLILARRFDPEARLAEEASLLDNWRVNLVQLDPWRVIICVAHGENTVEKREVRDRMAARHDSTMRRSSARNPAKIIRDAAARDFYRAMFQPPNSSSSSLSPSSFAALVGAPSAAKELGAPTSSSIMITTESAMRTHESNNSGASS